MNKLFLSTLVLVTVLLAACTTTTIGVPTSSTGNELPIETQLAVGTLQLADSEQDVSADQAEELIVYWQVYRELSQSDTAAQAEIDGLIEQIQEAMTDTQIQTIADMKITQQDVLASIQAVGIVSTTSSAGTVSIPSSQAVPAGGPPADGGMPVGGEMPRDMPGAAPASGMDQIQSTAAAAGLTGTASVRSALVDAVIQSLQQKIAAQTNAGWS